jgi:SpoVK/Ycf46/Vps4 family AAA+-type ATPase
VRALFSVAAKISPCVIFVDELDGLFRERGGEDHDVSRDLKTEFLQLWDGIRHHHLQGGGFSGSSSVLVIGATNRPFDVDPAFLRRMPRRIFVGLPDYEARVAVLNNMLQSVPLDASFDIDLVARNTRGYSPSDMREVLQAAALFPLREARAAAVSYDGEGMSKAVPLSIPALRALRTEDVLKALEGAKPTHFSKTYERDLMEYVRRSGGAEDSHYGDQSPTVSDADGSQFIADAGAYFGNQEERDSDEYSYDDESESDDFL